MGGCRCSYRNCTNTTKTRDNLHFFHYPVKHKDRCKQWIENAQKPQFYDLDEIQLRNKVICETHFMDCYFPNIQKKRLLQGAIPTLDGDSDPKKISDSGVKIQDVQVLPANADGTIFVLETNMQNNFQSDKVESYIYTNNGLMVPIAKLNDNVEDSVQSMQSIYSENDGEEVEEPPQSRVRLIPEMFTESIDSNKYENYIYEAKPRDIIEVEMVRPEKPKPVQKVTRDTMTDDVFSKSVDSKYVKKIKQHSKDIANIKRLLKSKTQYRRPTNSVILNTLKKQIPPSLFNLVKLNFTGSCDLSLEDLEFFSTIHSTSPQLYEILSQKYQWKLPNPEIFNNVPQNKNNGHVYCEDD